MSTVNLRDLNPEKAHEALTRADILASSGNLDGALNAIRDCLSHQPNNIEAYTLCTKIYIKARMYDEAHTIITKILKNGSPSEQTLLLKAKTELMITNKNHACKSTLDDVFAFKRDHPQGLLILADLNFKNGKYSEAIHIYERLQKLEPGNKEILYGLAESYFQLKDFDETIFYCKQIMDSQSGIKYIEHLYNRALRELKKKVLASRNHMTVAQKLYMFFKDPITDDQIRIKSIQDRSIKRSEKEKYRDAVTEGLNAKAMEDHVPAILHNSTQDIYLGHCDIDFFKAFNDFYSYEVGDVVLKTLNKIGNSIFPERFYRKGGEEFCWVFAGSEQDVYNAAKEFREKVENSATKDANEYIKEKRVLNPTSGNLFHIDRNISISQGVALYKTNGHSLKELLAFSNVSLKKCKEQYGRNCIVIDDLLVDQGVKPEVPEFKGR